MDKMYYDVKRHCEAAIETGNFDEARTVLELYREHDPERGETLTGVLAEHMRGE